MHCIPHCHHCWSQQAHHQICPATAFSSLSPCAFTPMPTPILLFRLYLATSLPSYAVNPPLHDILMQNGSELLLSILHSLPSTTEKCMPHDPLMPAMPHIPF